jgi:hypothetical protein
MKLKTKFKRIWKQNYWKQNLNEIENKYQTKLKTKLLKIKFKWNWKQNSNIIENKIIENKI